MTFPLQELNLTKALVVQTKMIHNHQKLLYHKIDPSVHIPLVYLTIIPQARVGYEMVVANEAPSAELAIIISYPTRATGIIVLLKTPHK